jgi:hypothetical protein
MGLLVRALMHARDDVAVLHVHLNLVEERRRQEWEDWAIGGLGYEDLFGQQLRARLAAQNPRSRHLAPYRQGGIDYLLSIALDREASAADRYDSLHVLGIYGDLRVRDALRRLEDDDTLYIENQGRIGQDSTMRGYARRAMQRIEERSLPGS